MRAELQKHLRQFLASRAEIGAGDRMVFDTLRCRARARQRWWLGLPLLTLGAPGAFALAGRRHRDVDGSSAPVPP